MRIIFAPRIFFFLFPFLYWAVLYFACDFNGLYGQDAHEYYRYAKALRGALTEGAPPGDYFWPVLYPLSGTLLSFLTGGNVLLALQFVSALAFGGMLALLHKQLLRNGGEQAKVFFYLLLACALCPLLLRSSALVMSDMLSVFFTCAAFLLLHRLLEKISAAEFFAYVFCAGAAVMTRYASAVVLLVPSLFLAYRFVREKKLLLLAAGLLPAAMAFLPHVLLRGNHAGDFIAHEWLRSWSPANFFEFQFSTNEGYVRYVLPNMLAYPAHLFGPKAGLVFLPLLLLGLKRVQRTAFQRLLFWSMLLYLLFLAGIPFQNIRFVLPLLPLLLLYCWPAVKSISLRSARVKIVALLLLPVQAYFIFTLSNEYIQRNRFERALAALVEKHEGRTLYTFSVDMALKSYEVRPGLISLWKKPLSDFEEGALVLFNEKAFGRQWKGRTPMANWELLKNTYHLQELEQGPQGWTLYRIGKKIALSA